jgi:hypothetical protein
MSVREIIDYCIDHYEEHGCDIVVETMSREEIASLIEGCETFEEALNNVMSWVAPIHGYREEIRSTIW